MIRTYKNRETERLTNRERVRKYQSIARQALRALRRLAAAESLEDLKVPPGNRLHALKGDRAGQHSISVNDQWRICFEWREDGAYEVEIADYH